MIPYGRQQIDEKDIAAVVSVLESDYLTTGPQVELFESLLAKRLSVDYAIACSSGTAGLHLAMLAAGIGEGDFVIVPSITFLATANCVRFVGAEVKFVDVDPVSGLIDLDHLESILVNKENLNYKAIIPVHLNGQSYDIVRLSKISNKHNLVVVEDACHALGTESEIEGKKALVGDCLHSDMAVFSFHPVKNITTGEGGMITTNNAELYEKLSLFRSHGVTRSQECFVNKNLAYDSSGNANAWYYEMQALGYNYRITDLQCALGISQLSKLNKFNLNKAKLVNMYNSELSKFNNLITPVSENSKMNIAWHLYVVLIDFESMDIDRNQLINSLLQNGIQTQVHYIPVHLQPYYSERYGEVDLPGAMSYYKKALSLPMYSSLKVSDVEYIISKLDEILSC